MEINELDKILKDLATEAEECYDIYSEYYRGINDTLREIRENLKLPKDERLEQMACMIG